MTNVFKGCFLKCALLRGRWTKKFPWAFCQVKNCPDLKNGLFENRKFLKRQLYKYKPDKNDVFSNNVKHFNKYKFKTDAMVKI